MQTVISAFNDQQTAQRAMEQLISAGFSRDNVHVQAGYDDGAAGVTGRSANGDAVSTSTSGRVSAAGHGPGQDRGFFASVGDFFADLFGSDTPSGDAGTYSEAVRRGNTVVVVDAANEVEAERAADIMDELGAIDIAERATQWKEKGWNGFDSSAMPLSRDDIDAERRISPTMDRQSLQAGGQTIPNVAPQGVSDGERGTLADKPLNVVQEELQVGKRSVDRGGVRVVQRVSERPVRELVQLREERATVERRPVDREATAADLETFKDGTIEVRETSEEVVVAKTARVIEEVVIGKDIQERTETINDTVRRKDVEIERLEGQTGSRTQPNREHATASEKLGAGLRDAKNDVDDSIRKDPSGRNS